MIPQFNYYNPLTVEELIKYLGEFNDNSRIIAGGTDVVPGFMQESSRFMNITNLIDINNIHELKSIKLENEFVVIGAAATFSAVCKSELIQKHFPLLAKSSSTVGSLQIRNRATVVGNFVNNAPCADSVPPLLVYNALIKIVSPAGTRTMPLQDFLVNPYKTQLMKNECVTEVLLPIDKNNLSGDFYKLGRRSAVSISRITLAFLMNVENNLIKEFRVASGAITPIGKRFPELESFAQGLPASTDTFICIAEKMGQIVLDTTGLRWSTHYKLPVLQQMLYQILENNFRKF